MSKPHNHRPPSGRTNLASCIVATIFLIFVVIIGLILYFMLLKPKDPDISVSGVQLASFSILNNTVNFTFSQFVSVKNPNKAVFSHYDSTIQLIYSGNQVGFMFIPAGKIEAGRNQFMAATFTVKSFPLGAFQMEDIGGIGPGPVFGGEIDDQYQSRSTMEIESRMKLAGRVRVLHFFTHHVDSKSGCKVVIDVRQGAVSGFRC